VEGIREHFNETDVLAGLADGEQPGIAGELAWQWLGVPKKSRTCGPAGILSAAIYPVTVMTCRHTQ
jgi:hypothetical protein